ncbi:MAG: guanylate kinase [Bacteroidaceae bacterium]|nr:guanylate kinase [Bacteroidaceae bacterium]MCF0243450.1 guanylate kinase [Bacteroidaceae bacterium]
MALPSPTHILTSDPLIIAIVGPSGAGKDTIAEILCNSNGWNRVVSFTTRPMREGERDGVEHWFVNEMPRGVPLLAQTTYGGYKYWTTAAQVVKHEVSVYIIDEAGLADLQQTVSMLYKINIVKVYVERDEEIRYQSGVSAERIKRDRHRMQFHKEYYDYIIINNKSISALKHRLRALAKSIYKKYINT